MSHCKDTVYGLLKIEGYKIKADNKETGLISFPGKICG
jgi:hypothetical protein